MAENFYGATDTGRLRDNNEDAFIAQEVINGKYIVGCAIDGVGGYEGGEVAAALAKETIIKILSLPFDDVEKTLHAALRFANEKIFEEKEQRKGNINMACVLTLVLADVINNKFYYAHIGDTRLYLLRDHSLVKVTKDHSFVGYLEDSGRLTEESAMNHPKRNEINKALGFDPQLHTKADSFDVGNSPFLPGDILFLCSDGLSDMVNSSKIVSVLTAPGSLEQKGRELIDAANEAGGKDNITVVLVHNDKQRVQHQATKPALEKAAKDPPLPQSRPVQDEKPRGPQPRPGAERSRAEALAGKDDAVITELEPKKRFDLRIIILIVVLVILGGALLWYFNRDKKEEIIVPLAIEPVAKSPQELMLHDSISYGLSPVSLQISTIDTGIDITDTVIIARDTLHVNGNGLILRCDSSFRGPVFFLNPTAAYVVLENITFQDFPVAIISDSKGLHLSKVKFLNCDVPVQYNFLLPKDQNISGIINDSSFLQNDSVPPKQTVWP